MFKILLCLIFLRVWKNCYFVIDVFFKKWVDYFSFDVIIIKKLYIIIYFLKGVRIKI